MFPATDTSDYSQCEKCECMRSYEDFSCNERICDFCITREFYIQEEVIERLDELILDFTMKGKLSKNSEFECILKKSVIYLEEIKKIIKNVRV